MENEMPDRSSKLKRQAQEGDRELIDIIKPDNSLKGFPTSIGKVLWLFLTFHHFFILSTKLTNFFSPTFFLPSKSCCDTTGCVRRFSLFSISMFLFFFTVVRSNMLRRKFLIPFDSEMPWSVQVSPIMFICL